MGDEFAQTAEWNENKSLDWHLLDYSPHKGMLRFVTALNRVYKSQPALYQKAFVGDGFQWVEQGDYTNSVYAYLRKGYEEKDNLLVILNLTPVVRKEFRIGIPKNGVWEEILNSDQLEFNGSGLIGEAYNSTHIHWMGFEQSITITLPPLGGIILKRKA